VSQRYGLGVLLVSVPFGRRIVKGSGWAFVILEYRYSSVCYGCTSYLLHYNLTFNPSVHLLLLSFYLLSTFFNLFTEGEIIFILSLSYSSIFKELHSSPSELVVLLL
jgi:hypothetical protein